MRNHIQAEKISENCISFLGNLCLDPSVGSWLITPYFAFGVLHQAEILTYFQPMLFFFFPNMTFPPTLNV